MPTPTDDRRDLLTVVARTRAAPGRRDELRAALEALIGPTGQEEGYVGDDLHRGIEDPDRFSSHENGESDADLDGHLDAPHLRDFAARIPELRDDSGLSVDRAPHRQPGPPDRVPV